jgi:hypothetical protein
MLSIVSVASNPEGRELVVADDGSIPAAQLRDLGLGPGAHLRVVQTSEEAPVRQLAGSLPELPDLSWDDFERASELARKDAAASWG